MKHVHSTTVALVLLLGTGLLYQVLGGWLGADQAVLLGSDHVDMWGTHWFYWMFEERLFGGEPFAHTNLLFYPWGKDVYLHTGGNVVDALLALPFRWILGSTEGYNVFVVAILLSNGFAGGWLVRGLGAKAVACVVVGTIAMLNPFCLAELSEGRLTQAILIFPTLFLGEWFGLLQEPRRGRVLRAALWLALTGLVYWYYAMFCGALAALMAGMQALEYRRAGQAYPWRKVGAVGLLSLVAVLPLAWPMLEALGGGGVPGLLAVDDWTWTQWKPVTQEGYAMGMLVFDLATLQTGLYYLDAGEIQFLSPVRTMSVSTMALAGLGLIFAPRRWRWTVIAGLILLLLVAMGPVLWDGVTSPIYVMLAKIVSPLQRLWWPGRALGIVTLLLLPPMAWALSRLEASWKMGLVGFSVLLVLGWELSRAGLTPLPTTRLVVPDVVDCLANGEGAILDLPYGDNPERLLFQTIHGRARLGGMLESNPVFVPEEHARFLEENAAIRALSGVVEGQHLCRDGEPELACVRRPSGDEIQSLGSLGFSVVVVDREGLGGRTGAGGTSGAESRARLRLRELLGEEVYQNEDTMVYLPWGGNFDCEAPQE